MKNMLLTLTLLATLASFCVAHADAGYGRGAESDPIATPILTTATNNIATLQGQMTTVQNGTSTWAKAATDAVTATSGVASVTALITSQHDTNATTTATLYTPRFIGDYLVGGTGAVDTAVWFGTALTTNSWIIISP